MAAEITLTTVAPEPPAADFAFEIDFKNGEGSPSRVFLAINDFIRGCEKLDAELAHTIDNNIETVLVLEDIEAGSIKVWLRNTLRAVEDDALKTLDWKPLVGKYLVRAKYVVLRWLDDESGTPTKSSPNARPRYSSHRGRDGCKALARLSAAIPESSIGSRPRF
jgi:hypothetical protein